MCVVVCVCACAMQRMFGDRVPCPFRRAHQDKESDLPATTLATETTAQPSESSPALHRLHAETVPTAAYKMSHPDMIHAFDVSAAHPRPRLTLRPSADAGSVMSAAAEDLDSADTLADGLGAAESNRAVGAAMEHRRTDAVGGEEDDVFTGQVGCIHSIGPSAPLLPELRRILAKRHVFAFTTVPECQQAQRGAGNCPYSIPRSCVVCVCVPTHVCVCRKRTSLHTTQIRR